MKLAGVPPPVGVAVPARGAEGIAGQEVAPTPEAARRRRRPARSHGAGGQNTPREVRQKRCASPCARPAAAPAGVAEVGGLLHPT